MNTPQRQRRRLLAAALCSAMTLAAIQTAAAAEPVDQYPSKAVRLVVPFAAGGPVDALARALGASLTGLWGQPVVVDNRPGANEVIGATNVARAAPDGYTLMLATDPSLSLNPFLYKKLAYDAERDLSPVTRVAISEMALVVPKSLPANTLQEFVDYARAHPGTVSYGSSGIGNGTHLSMAQFGADNGLDLLHVPYKGLAPTLQDMMSGNVQSAVGAVSVIAPFVQEGKLKVLGVSGDTRASVWPEVPTFAEGGYPDFEARFYFGVIAPAGIPPALREKIANGIRQVASTPEFQEKNFQRFALTSVLDTPAEFEAFLVKDRAAAQAKIAASGASLD